MLHCDPVGLFSLEGDDESPTYADSEGGQIGEYGSDLHIVTGLVGEGFVIRIGFEIVAIKKVYMHV